MLQNDLTITTLLCFVLLLLAMMGLLVLVVSLLRQGQKQSQSHTQLLVSLLETQTQESQSLRNQLRAADVVSLHGLNAATAVPKTASQSEPFVPAAEGIQYYQDLETAGYGIEGTSDEFAARGWDPIITDGTDGGNPVTA